MATVVVNKPDLIEFKNLDQTTASDSPTLTVTAGIWQTDDSAAGDTGVVFDVSGNSLPLLTTADARKLARWLTKAADDLEGVKQDKKKNKPRRHWVDDDDDDYS